VIGDDLTDYQDAIHREWLGNNRPLPDDIWGHGAGTSAEYPWAAIENGLPGADERKRRDQWQSQFMPSGALVGTRVDTGHWLAGGTGDFLTVLFSNSPILMSKPPVQHRCASVCTAKATVTIAWSAGARCRKARS
jgi:hypothetical protein